MKREFLAWISWRYFSDWAKILTKFYFQLDDDDAVYDVVDEDKYAQIVEERRKGGDFVVDDGRSRLIQCLE